MELSVLKTDGTDAGKKVTLDDSIYGIEPNDKVLYEDIRAIQSNMRQGTAKTKNRNEVRGGGRKAYRQKGTGNARRGTIRSPLLVGGGTVFGPQPRTYSVNLTKKMRRLARKSALAYKAKEDAITVVEDFSFDEPKTKNLVTILDAVASDKKVLLVIAGSDKNVALSGRNLPKTKVITASNINTLDVMHADVVLFTESAVTAAEEVLNGKPAEA